MKEMITFTCAVCPNGCRLSVEVGEKGTADPIETGRCVRGNLMIGKEYVMKEKRLCPVDKPMSKHEIAELVDHRRKKITTP